jgi:hypothetical protein
MRDIRRVGPGGARTGRGTRLFKPGAKLHCVNFFWGGGVETLEVVGRHRKSHRYIKAVVRSKDLERWRAELVYSPHVIGEIDGRLWNGSIEAKERAEELAHYLKTGENHPRVLLRERFEGRKPVRLRLRLALSYLLQRLRQIRNPS